MACSSTLAAIGADLVSLRRRVDALSDPRLETAAVKLLQAQTAINRVVQSDAGRVEHFGR